MFITIQSAFPTFKTSRRSEDGDFSSEFVSNTPSVSVSEYGGLQDERRTQNKSESNKTDKILIKLVFVQIPPSKLLYHILSIITTKMRHKMWRKILFFNKRARRAEAHCPALVA